MREFNFTAANRKIREILKGNPDVATGMSAIIDYCEKKCPDPLWENFRRLDFVADVGRIGEWLTKHLTERPPDPRINGFWFGINEGGDLYLQGTAHMAMYSPGEWDWAFSGVISYESNSPHEAPSKILSEIRKTAEHLVGGLRAALDYTCGVMFVSLAVAQLGRTLPLSVLLGPAPSRGMVVGLDEDAEDFIVIGTLTSQGLGPFRKPSPKEVLLLPPPPPSDFYALQPPVMETGYQLNCPRPDQRPPTRYYIEKMRWMKKGPLPDFMFCIEGGFVVTPRAAEFLSGMPAAKIQLFPCIVGKPNLDLIHGNPNDKNPIPGEFYFFKPGVIVPKLPATANDAPAPLFRALEKGYFCLAIVTAEFKRQLEEAGITGLGFEPVGGGRTPP